MDETSFNLMTTKDTGLVGAIGETIAWQFLWDKKVVAHNFGMGRPSFSPGSLTQTQPQFYPSWLKKRQSDYLIKLWKHGPRRWDFVAINFVETEVGGQNRKPKTVYVVEVKVRRNRRSSLKSLTGKIPTDLEKVKSLGFVPLLVIVDMLDNWEFGVTCKDL